MTIAHPRTDCVNPSSLNFYLGWFLLGCIAAALLSGCGQKGTVRHDDRHQFPVGHVKKTGDVEPQLRVEASRWHGTPHRMGGNDLNGVDCSGLVRRIYKDLFGIQIPRTASEQAGLGFRISKDELEPGDLVFFKPPGKKNHVGIYLGKGEFVHTSAKRGVMISKMDLNYWKKYYWTARRIPLQ